jgi:hypothetical protein
MRPIFGYFEGTKRTMGTLWVLFGPISGHFVGTKETICLQKLNCWALLNPLFGHFRGTFWITLKPRKEIISIKLMVKIRKYRRYLHRK